MQIRKYRYVKRETNTYDSTTDYSPLFFWCVYPRSTSSIHKYMCVSSLKNKIILLLQLHVFTYQYDVEIYSG